MAQFVCYRFTSRIMSESMRSWYRYFPVILLFVICACGNGSTSTPSSQENQRTSSPSSSQQNRRDALKAVALIFSPIEGSQDAIRGSASIIDPNGILLTNSHVIRDTNTNKPYNDTDRIVVAISTSPDQVPNKRFLAQALAVDKNLDLAVLRLVSDEDGKPITAPLNLPSISLGDSDEIQVGDRLQVVGFPGVGGSTITVTEGIVSGFLDGRNWIKTDTEINPGNSGGLAINQAGELIGIPTLASISQGNIGKIGVIRPINLAKPLLQSVLQPAAITAVTPNSPTQSTNTASGNPNLGGGRDTPAPSELPNEVATAFEKTKNATNARYQVSAQVTFVQDGKEVQQPGMSAQGEGSGANQYISISGVLNATGQLATFEIITLDGETYLKGLAGLPGVEPGAWYHFPKELGNVSKDAPTALSLLTDIDIQDFQRGQFIKSETQTLDGQQCTVWTAQNAQLAQTFVGIANSPEAEAQLERIDDAEFQVWTCPDGYLHQIAGTVKGHNPNKTSDHATVVLNFHLYDFGMPIKITAPPDAKEFQLPQRPPAGTPPP